jgi:hypothetical protein
MVLPLAANRPIIIELARYRVSRIVYDWSWQPLPLAGLFPEKHPIAGSIYLQMDSPLTLYKSRVLIVKLN